jgi:hypothetical protein
MAEYLGQQEGLDDPALVVERVLDEVRRAFDGFDPSFLERVTREAVDELWGESIRVTSFVPVLAMRQIRERIALRGIERPETPLIRVAEPVMQHA